MTSLSRLETSVEKLSCVGTLRRMTRYQPPKVSWDGILGRKRRVMPGYNNMRKDLIAILRHVSFRER